MFLCLNLRFLCENGGLVFISIKNKFASPYLLIWGLVGLDRIYITVCLVGGRLNLTSRSSKSTMQHFATYMFFKVTKEEESMAKMQIL